MSTPRPDRIRRITAVLLCAGLAACSHRPVPVQKAGPGVAHGATLRQGIEAQALPRGQTDGLKPTARELRGIGGEVRGLGNETTGAQEALAPPVSSSNSGSGSGSGSGGGR
jgi:hypothetical protein